MATITRTEYFVNQVNSASLDDIPTICTSELTYLRNALPALSTFKAWLSAYRGAVVDAVENDEKIALVKKILVLTMDEKTKLKTAYNNQLNQDHSALRAIYDVEQYIDISGKLLRSNAIHDVIAGLCALTGRRVSEIGVTGRFSLVDDMHINFHGQLKTKNIDQETPEYVIPVLGDVDSIIRAHDVVCSKYGRYRAKDLQNYQDIKTKAKQFHNAVSKEIGQKVKKHYQGILAPNSKGTLQPKDLRSAYAIICYDFFGHESTSMSKYFSMVLGHGETDVMTAQSYVDFFIKNT